MNKIVIFALGVATGSVGTYFAVRKVIETKTDEEIESVVTTFKKRFEELENAQKPKTYERNTSDAADALAASFQNLKEMSGKVTYAYTGTTIKDLYKNKEITFCDICKVYIKNISD